MKENNEVGKFFWRSLESGEAESAGYLESPGVKVRAELQRKANTMHALPFQVVPQIVWASIISEEADPIEAERPN